MATCSNCGSSNVQFRRENVGEVRGKKAKQVVHRTVGYCKDCGNTWVASSDDVAVPKKRKTWLWVLGWLFIFPLPLTILLLRKKDMNKIVKYIIIAVAWLVYFGIAAAGGGDSKTKEAAKPEETQTISETSTVAEEATTFVLSADEVGNYGEEKTVNANTEMPLTYVEFRIPAGVYDVTNKSKDGTSQVSVYSGVEFDGQWEQFVARQCDNPIVIAPGETKSLTIQEGQFVKLSDKATDIEFVKTGNVETWDERFERTEQEVLDYIDNTLTPEYKKRIDTTLDYNVNEPGTYYTYVEILMDENTPAFLRSSMKTIEERMREAPYDFNTYLIYSTSKGAGVCSTAVGNGFSDYTVVVDGHRYQYNSIDEIPDDLF